MFLLLLFVKKLYIKEFYLSCIQTGKFIFDLISNSYGPNIGYKLIINKNDFLLSKRGVVFFDITLSNNLIFLIFSNILTIQKNSFGDGSITIILLIYSFFKKTVRMFSRGVSLLEINKNYIILFNIVNKILNMLTFKIIGWKKSKDYFILSVYSNLVSKLYFFRIFRPHVLSSRYAELCVNASLTVYDYKKNTIKINLIKIEGRFGVLAEDSYLIKGFIIQNGFSNIWVPKKLHNAIVMVTSNKLEPSTIDEINVVEINQFDSFKKIWEIKKKFYNDIIISFKKIKINLLVTQWGVKDELKYLFFKNNISILCWVGSNNLEILSIITKARIIANYFDINFNRVGFSKLVREFSFQDHSKVLIFDNFYSPKCVTIFLICTKNFILKENKILIKNAIKTLSILLKTKNFLLTNGYSELVIVITLFNLNSRYFYNSNDFLNCFTASLEIIPAYLLQYSKKNSKLFIDFLKRKIIILSSRTYIHYSDKLYIEPKSIRQSIYYLVFKTVFILANISKVLY
uniref:T-complex protein epsilon-SU n=1 Tax=Lotharella vacuolata TaxID=74820 RepID=A0A0H5BK34_9EUKA|nr:T-complex protein epsilon-SU [Lotharella vacuolata]